MRYTNKGTIRYRRCSKGNVGFEVGGERDQEEQPLIFSEARKTLQSPRGFLVPNKVVEWLMGKSLAQLVTLSKEGRNARKAVISCSGNDRVEWSETPAQDGPVIRYTCFARVVGGALIYTMMDSTTKKEEELEYSEEAKGWVSCRNEVLPGEVLTWMQRAVAGTADERARRFMERYAERPWQVVPPCVNASFPVLKGTDLAQLEAYLGYKFCNCALLLEALTHPSMDTQSMTPSNAKLAFLGSLIAEALVVELLLDSASFCTAETARHDTVPRASTYAVTVGQDKCVRWPDGSREVNSKGINSLEELQRQLAACCSSVACADSATRLGLHKGLQCRSPQLEEDMRCFSRVRRQALRSGDEAASWRKVLAHGAPKALGDVFLATVAAVVLDRGTLKAAMHILLEHVRYCSALHDLPKSQEVETWTLAETLDTQLHEALELAGPVFDRAAVKAEIRDGALDATQGQPGVQVPTPTLQDVHLFKLREDGSDWRLICDVSPRTAKLRAPFLDDMGCKPCSDSDEESTQEDKLESVTCHICKMLLNGRNQYQDHLKGKRHRKSLTQSAREHKLEP